MFAKSSLVRTTALTLAASIMVGGLLPTVQASAHDRHHAAKHGYQHGNWNKRHHRKFHKQYGKGNHGIHAYNKSRHHGHKRRKKSNKGDLIAAGVIGLALGAIIASEASKKKHRDEYKHSSSQPSYNYDQYDQPYNGQYSQGYNRSQHVPLDQYNNRTPQPYVADNDPEIITYRDTASLEPWTPGWREWCDNRYRSFNQNTGTYRGYDGHDHFCVPK